MKLCRIIGKVWATVMDEQLTGTKLLLAREININGELQDSIIVAVDELGAGENDTVIISEGEPVIRTPSGNKPVDSVIIAIVERYTIKNN